MNAVRELCDRAIILDCGKLVFDGGINEGVDAYLSSVRVASKKDPTTRKDRSGSGRGRIQQVEISAGENATERGLVTGLAARFVFHLDRALEAVDCVFTLYDEKGMAVVSFQSQARAPDDERVGSCYNQIVCEIEEFLLLPGTYHLNAALFRKGEILDHVEGLSVFEVSPGSIRGRILDKTSKFGFLHMPHRWCLRAKLVEPDPAELKGQSWPVRKAT